MARGKKPIDGEDVPEKLKGLVYEEVPEDFDFDQLRWAAVQILAEHSLATISSLVRASTIQRDDKYTKTACIGRRGRKLEIRYNGGFVYTFARRPIEFAGLIAHEIFHEILRHLEFQRYKGNQQGWNVAMDCMIQSTLSQMNKPPRKVGTFEKAQWKYTGGWQAAKTVHRPESGFHITALMEKIYDLSGLDSLMRPPNPLKRIGRNETTGDAEVDSIRAKIYPEGKSATVNEVDIYKFIMRKFPDQLPNILVIGDHNGEPSDEKTEGQAPYREGSGDVINEPTIIQICEETEKAAGYSTALTEHAKTVIKKKNKQLEAALDQALIDNVKSKIVAGVGSNLKPGRTVVMPSDMTRSDLIKISAGYYPIFFTKRLPDSRKVKVNVYIDVSGSCEGYIAWMYGCILDLTRIAEIRCFLFSNDIKEITMDQIKEGKVLSTGGTDFDCIAEHSMLPDNIKEVSKAVIFTDGYASMKPENQKKLKDAGIQYIGAVFATAKYEYDHKTGKRGYVGTWATDGLKTFCVQVHEIPYLGENDI